MILPPLLRWLSIVVTLGSHSVLGMGWPKELLKVLTSICTCVHVLIKMLYSDKSLPIMQSR